MHIDAYLASSGTESFDFDRDGSHFVLNAVLVRDSQAPALAELLERFREGYFSREPLRAAGLAADPVRLLDVLKALRAVEFRIHALVVNKRTLQSEGFRDQSAFFGFLNNLVYQELFRAAPGLQLIGTDTSGFLPRFRAFVRERHRPDLFGGSDFGFVEPRWPALAGLSAMLAETLAMCFDGRLARPLADECLGRLKPMLGSLRQFPEAAPQPELLPESRYDALVAELGLRTARSFIDKARMIDPDAQDQIACARLLLLYFNTYGSDIYLTAAEIMQHLNATRHEALTARQFQTRVIAPLRDAGVLVVSSASGEHKGYKLPSSIADLHKFVSHGNSMIIPLLQRIRIFRETIRSASAGRLDILDTSDFRELQQLADALSGDAP